MQLSLLRLHNTHAGMTMYLQYKTLVSQFPFPLSVGEDMFAAGECDPGPWWPVPTAGFLMHLCAHTKLLGITLSDEVLMQS